MVDVTPGRIAERPPRARSKHAPHGVTPMPLIAALVILVPLIALTIAVVDTRRANARTGVPPVELTYRAYGA
jgi:hypothetical protein